MDEVVARHFAEEWIAAWNTHDVEGILSHYTDDVEYASPMATRIPGNTTGIFSGMETLRHYFTTALEAFPNLHFTLIDVYTGANSLVISYDNSRGKIGAETFELRDGKACRVYCNYHAKPSDRA